ncbi:MAG: Cytochrome c, mono- and diheme variants [Chloroflexi bacterium]|nr:MAG: Cytochrome c, mono- and diheme variants [Chloroflexota bacterium]
MSGQNTHKQITAMVLLMFLGVASLGAYVWFDDGRRSEAEDQHLIESAERGARLFANNCSVCHGNAGEGLIGPALNTPANTLAFRSANAGALGEIEARFRATIECGRNGTAMPPWAVEHGGSLNFFHIENLVTLVTTNSGNAWEEALALAIEHDEASLQSLESVYATAKAGATAQGIANAVNAAIDAADGDVDLALRESLLALTRANIAVEVTAEFADALADAQAAEDEDALDDLELQIDERRAEVLDALVAASLADADGDVEVALIDARAAIAELAAETALATLEAAEANVAAGRPVQQAATPLAVTAGTCGQRQ